MSAGHSHVAALDFGLVHSMLGSLQYEFSGHLSPNEADHVLASVNVGSNLQLGRLAWLGGHPRYMQLDGVPASLHGGDFMDSHL